MEATNWKDIPGFEGLYRINKEGTVKSIPRIVNAKGDGVRPVPEKIISAYLDNKGRRKVQLFKKHKKYTRSVEKLLKELFSDSF